MGSPQRSLSKCQISLGLITAQESFPSPWPLRMMAFAYDRTLPAAILSHECMFTSPGLQVKFFHGHITQMEGVNLSDCENDLIVCLVDYDALAVPCYAIPPRGQHKFYTSRAKFIFCRYDLPSSSHPTPVILWEVIPLAGTTCNVLEFSHYYFLVSGSG